MYAYILAKLKIPVMFKIYLFSFCNRISVINLEGKLRIIVRMKRDAGDGDQGWRVIISMHETMHRAHAISDLKSTFIQNIHLNTNETL